MSGQHQPTLALYQQVANSLRIRLADLADEPPTTLPQERDLAVAYDVARSTIRRALDLLESEELITRTRGYGTVSVPANIRIWRRMRQARTIQVVTNRQSPHISAPHSFYGQVFQGILAQAELESYHVSIQHMTASFPPVDASYNPADPAHVVGVIIANVFDERVIAMHVDAGYPVVCADHWTTNPQADAVVADCFGEGYMAVEFLLSQGHRDLFYVGNTPGGGFKRPHERDADLMLAGCRHALESRDLSLPDSRVRYCCSDNATTGRPDAVAETVGWFASLTPRPTAGVVFSPDTLTHFRRMLDGIGLACPDDVSLVGKAYVGQETDATCLVTTPMAIGTASVRLVLERAAGHREFAERIAIPSTLRRGRTVARRDVDFIRHTDPFSSTSNLA